MNLGPLTKVEWTPEPATIAELHEFFGFKPDGEPKLVGYYDRRGKLRRIVASYPDGWRCRVNINATGHVTSTIAELRLKPVKVGSMAP